MGNAQHPGVTPIDPATPIGGLRTLVGDTASTELDPPVAGQANYGTWSDADLLVALNTYKDSPLRAAGLLYRQLAAQYAQSGRSIKTDDLSIDTRSRGSDLFKTAQSFFDDADKADKAAASDFFQIVPFAGRKPRDYADTFFFANPTNPHTSISTDRDIEDAIYQWAQSHPEVDGYTHVQSVALSVWTIPHTFNRVPDVTVYVGGVLRLAEVEASITTVVISFPVPTSGIAILS